MTCSPTESVSTPGPTRSTTPAPSSPSTIGTGTPFQLPSAACRQLWQTPLATIRTSTSPVRGGSSSSSSTFSGVACSNSTDALIRGSPGGGSRLIPDARIEVTVQHVDGQVDRHEQQRDEQDRALRQRVVPLVDRPQHEPADAGQ